MDTGSGALVGMSILPSGQIDDATTDDDDTLSNEQMIDNPGGISLVAVTRKVSSTFARFSLWHIYINPLSPLSGNG